MFNQSQANGETKVPQQQGLKGLVSSMPLTRQNSNQARQQQEIFNKLLNGNENTNRNGNTNVQSPKQKHASAQLEQEKTETLTWQQLLQKQQEQFKQKMSKTKSQTSKKKQKNNNNKPQEEEKEKKKTNNMITTQVSGNNVVRQTQKVVLRDEKEIKALQRLKEKRERELLEEFAAPDAFEYYDQFNKRTKSPQHSPQPKKSSQPGSIKTAAAAVQNKLPEYDALQIIKTKKTPEKNRISEKKPLPSTSKPVQHQSRNGSQKKDIQRHERSQLLKVRRDDKDQYQRKLKRRRARDDYDDESSQSIDGFIESDEEKNEDPYDQDYEVQKFMNKIRRAKASRRINDELSDDVKEARFDEIEEEEYRSKKIGSYEDEVELERERRKELRRQQRGATKKIKRD